MMKDADKMPDTDKIKYMETNDYRNRKYELQKVDKIYKSKKS